MDLALNKSKATKFALQGCPPLDSPQLPPTRFDLPLTKAQYLFSSAGQPGKGGNKQKFWTSIMGYPTPKAIQLAILSAVQPEALIYERENDFGRIYRAYIELRGPSGLARRIRPVWIWRFEEDVTRFVTAVPDRLGGLT